jgi:GTP diphosphokinase / guanosine-3',5'-bis(diphosphate) 3'-diphosphatase
MACQSVSQGDEHVSPCYLHTDRLPQATSPSPAGQLLSHNGISHAIPTTANSSIDSILQWIKKSTLPRHTKGGIISNTRLDNCVQPIKRVDAKDQIPMPGALSSRAQNTKQGDKVDSTLATLATATDVAPHERANGVHPPVGSSPPTSGDNEQQLDDAVADDPGPLSSAPSGVATPLPVAPPLPLEPDLHPTEAPSRLGVLQLNAVTPQMVAPLLATIRRLEPIPTSNKQIFIHIDPTPEELYALEIILQRLPASFTTSDREQILRAYSVASYAHRAQQRESGEPYIMHPLAVTAILADMRMDTDTLMAGLLHDVVEDTEFDLAYVAEQFGATTANLVDGVTKLKRINEMSNAQQGIADAKAESLRKMFLAMVDDVRVVLIKLSDRLHNMRTLGGQKKHKQKRIARETLDIFAPLANRLGIWQIKWELEDLSFRYLEPNTYRELARAMQQKREERERFVMQIKHDLEAELARAGIPAEISGRPKHIYSIYRKMKRKDVDFDQIYDIHGFRIILENDGHCYAALGVVHNKWRPIPGEFDDYIASPKDNMYRSLHTAVLSKGGRPMEIQIRTREMHDIAERGVAAHWQYKEQRKHDESFHEKIKWLRQLMEWRQDVTDATEFVAGMKTDVFNERVYVFTPQGDVIDLPAGSTPIDFAYAIHTELGDRCRGANIRGRLAPLDYKLQNGDQVTIIAAKRGGPSRDWLNPNLEYVATQRARSKIRSWLRKQGRDENIQRGRQMLEKEMKRLAITDSFDRLAKLFNLDKVDDFLAAIGCGDINSQHLATKVLDHERREIERHQTWEDRLADAVNAPSKRTSTGDGFRVQGVDGLLTHLGRCCNPVPGDPIVGYVTRGRGVTVHRTTCPNITNIVRKGQETRMVDVQWSAKPEATFPVNIQVSAYDRAGLMRDFAALVADEQINMVAVEALTGQKDNLALINATLEIQNATQLTRILTKIDRLPNVLDARRRLH